MFLDFILFWSVSLTALRLGTKGLLSAEAAGVILFADSGPRRPPIMVEGGHLHGDCGQQVMAA